MTILDTLRSITFFPIPEDTFMSIFINRGIDGNSETTAEIMQSTEYKLCLADVYRWLVNAPSSISENGISFSITSDDKARYRALASDLYEECGEKRLTTTYGYRGSRL